MGALHASNDGRPVPAAVQPTPRLKKADNVSPRSVEGPIGVHF